MVPTEKFAELANKGGTAPFVNATSEAAIGAAVDEVLQTLPSPSCVLPLAMPLQFADQALVELDGVDVPRVTDCTQEGWRFLEDAPPFTAIELCGAACTTGLALGVVDVTDCADVPG